MAGCFAFLKPRAKAANKMTSDNSDKACDCKGASLNAPAAAAKTVEEEKTPLSVSMYYDACNPPPFSAGEQQRCCGGITSQGLSHSHSHVHLPTYGDSQKHLHHAVRYTEPRSDTRLSEAMADVAKNIEEEIERLDGELRQLSLDMHDHPEIMWEEHKTHDLFVKYFSQKKGWKVTPHAFDQETAWQAVFSHKADKNSRVIGFQSELDALQESVMLVDTT